MTVRIGVVLVPREVVGGGLSYASSKERFSSVIGFEKLHFAIPESDSVQVVFEMADRTES